MAGLFVKKLLKQLRSNIITGVLLIIPLFVTVIIIVKLFMWVDSALPGVMGMDWAPGLGVMVILVIAYFAGLTAKNYFGKKLIATGNAVISNIPILNKVYLGVQQIVDVVTLNNKKLFDRAVMIEFPKSNCYSIGFVTCDHNAEFTQLIGRKLLAVFVPTTPNPTSGFLLYFPEEEVIDINIPVEAAVKLVMSAGMLNAENLRKMHGTYTVPNSLRRWNWMGLFKRDPAKKGSFDPRD